MDIRRLEVFCRVLELKSFTRAAEAVLLTQPTVSENVRLLEEEVGEKLLDRLGREVLPTPAGRLLYGYARRIIQLRDEALRAMRQYRGDLEGAQLYYHNAIHGVWPADPEQQRRAARLELIRLLLRQRQREQAESELIALAAGVILVAGVLYVGFRFIYPVVLVLLVAIVGRAVFASEPQLLGILVPLPALLLLVTPTAVGWFVGTKRKVLPVAEEREFHLPQR